MLKFTNKNLLIAAAISLVYFALALGTSTAIAVTILGGVTVLFALLKPRYRIACAWLLVLLAVNAIDIASNFDLIQQSYSVENYMRLCLLLAALMLTMPELSGLFTGGLGRLKLGLAVGIYAFYLLVCLTSAAWSAAPWVTLAKATEMLIGFLVPLSTMALADPGRELRRFYDLTIWFIAVNLISMVPGLLVVPENYWVYSTLTQSSVLGGGLTPISPNAVSRYGAFLSLLVATKFLMSKEDRNYDLLAMGLLFGLGIAMQVLSVGRTGIASFALGLCVLGLRRSVTTALLLLVALVAFDLFFVGAFFDFFRRGQDAADFASLSGRTDYWVAALHALQQSPLVGFGLGVGGRVALYSIGVRDVPGLHSGVFDTLIGTGLLGFIPWTVAVMIWLSRAIREFLAQRNVLMNMSLVPLLFATALSAGVGGWMSVEMGIFLIMMLHQAVSRAPAIGRSVAEPAFRYPKFERAAA